MTRIPPILSRAADIVIQVESAVVATFVELVAKLNDTAFRPLFRKLFDWAFTGMRQHVMYHNPL